MIKLFMHAQTVIVEAFYGDQIYKRGILDPSPQITS